MAVDTLYIDVENSAGTRQGNGPITSAADWRYTARMDAAGDYAFTMPATDPKAILIQKKRIVRAYAMLGNGRVEVGAGIIDVIEREPQDDGSVLLRVSGSDLLRELTYRSVLNLKLYSGGNPVTHAAALAAVGGFAPAGWIFTPDPTPPSNSVYGYFNGDTVLAGLIKVGEKSQTHFYRGAGRTVVFRSSFSSSGVRAIGAKGDLTAATCAITSLVEKTDLFDLITRIYPRGSGNAEAQLTLKATSRSAPAGYTLDKSANYIEHNASTAAYGRIERQVDFRDVGPVENTTPDVVAAANMLFDLALETLKRSSVELDQLTYSIAVEGCSALLRPMQTVRVAYRDLDAGLNINADLNILESTWQVGENGIGTTGLVVSNVDRWPESDQRALVGSIADGKVYQALPQLNANSYTTAYNKNIDYNNTASFRFRFGKEVTQLQSVLFEFQTLQFESTVKSVGTTSGGSGTVTTGGPNTNASGAPDNNSSGSPSNNTSGDATGNTGSASGNTGSASGSTGDTTTATNSVTGGTDSPSGGTNSPTGATNSPSGATSGDALVTDPPSGGDTVGSSGQHQHSTRVIAGSGSLGEVFLHVSGGIYFLSNPFVTGSIEVFTNERGNHQHYVNPHTHTVTAHSHTVNAHSHTVNAHGHTVNAHSHSVDAHSHTVGAHSHTVDADSHTLNNHSHSLNNHSHSLSGHLHSLNNHNHSLEGGIEAVYGIFRASLVSTYAYTDLEYRVNGGAWLPASASVDAGGGWRRLDITDLVMHPDTFRPLQENNTLEMRGAALVASIPILSWSVTAGTYLVVNTVTDHFLAVGDVVDIAGANLGVFNGTNINGENYPVGIIQDSNTFVIFLKTSLSGDNSLPGAAGAVTVHKQATIDAQLSVRNIIQAIAYA